MDTTTPTPLSQRRPRRGRSGLAALAVLAVMGAGYGTLAPSATAATAKVPASHVITAKLTEFKIALSRTKLTPGTYTFHTVNAGHTVHALEINGPGVTNKRTPGFLPPGKSANLTVTLRAGKYDVFCPVGDHKQLGMNLELTVGGSGAGATTAKTPPVTTKASGSAY